jgi:hypothetical protein
VARFLEQYRERHETIEGLIDRDFEMPTMGRPVTLAPDTRAAIDALFGASVDRPIFHELPGAVGKTASRHDDLGYFRRAVEYLRRVPGEKQLVLVAERRLGLGRIWEDPSRNYFVRLATGARVALSFIHAGGLEGQGMTKGRLRILRSPEASRGGSIMGISDNTFFAPTDHQLMADHTGGISAFYQYAARPLAYLDRATRFQYLLGYYPRIDLPDGEHRVVRVEVNRPGTTVLYRHGYQVRPPESQPEDFRRAVAEARITAALSRLTLPRYSELPQYYRIRTILTVQASASPRPNDEVEVKVRLSFDPSRVAFTRIGDEYHASLDLGIAIDDRDGGLLGERSERVDVKLSAREFERTKREWFGMTLDVLVKGRPDRVRAVVYDYDSDRVAPARAGIERDQAPLPS